MKLKNYLTTVIQEKNIQGLLDYTKNNYRPYDPGMYLYNLVTKYSGEKKFTEDFIELVYTTLIAWNMNQRGAKLSEFNFFKKSLIENQLAIQSLEKYRIEDLESIDEVKKQINFLFENLNLVAEDKPKLVTFSKTVHYFLPNLLMPIDRAYTLMFFYKNINFDKNKQIQIYFEIFEQFQQFAKKYIGYFDRYDNQWNKNIPKMIDNIIIAYIKQKNNSQ